LSINRLIGIVKVRKEQNNLICWN